MRRTENEIGWVEGRDVWYHDLVADQPAECEPEQMDAEDLLYILYTSGTTGKPKGIVHTTGGYLTGVAATHRWVFDLKDDDVYWCAADVGWVTGHSYIVYGPLANGATSVLYEGAPGTPDKDRWWEIIERYGVTILYCAPDRHPHLHEVGRSSTPSATTSARCACSGSVGEPINPEAWIWYRTHIGGDRCPVVDTWWQTETGNIMISPLPGVTTLKPGSATKPLPGDHRRRGRLQRRERAARPGRLPRAAPSPGRGCCAPSTATTTASSRPTGASTRACTSPATAARRDEDGDYWLLGRIDDVMNVSGHRLSTIEIESALVDHPKVAEAAVVGRADETTGQAIAAFVTLKGDVTGDEALIAELRQHVATKIGAIARPKSIVLTDDLPKTRSGKIMRRLLRDISEDRQLGDVTTLANEEVVATSPTWPRPRGRPARRSRPAGLPRHAEGSADEPSCGHAR